LRHEYTRWKVILEKNVYKKSYFELVHCELPKLRWIITYILVNEMFYVMHVLTIIITCTFLEELEVQERNFGYYMRTRVMDDAQGCYNHEEEIKGVHIGMRNSEIDSNGRKGKQDPLTMRSLHREV
jgi:hypothetical protein